MSKERIPLNLDEFAPAPKTASKERKDEIATEAVERGFSARPAVPQPFAVKLHIETNDAIYDMADAARAGKAGI